MTGEAIAAQASELRDRIRAHKRSIALQRVQLQKDATELTELEAHAKRLGLGLYLQQGVGDIHGRPQSGT